MEISRKDYRTLKTTDKGRDSTALKIVSKKRTLTVCKTPI